MANAYDIALSFVGQSIDVETNGMKAIPKVVLAAYRGSLYQCVDLPNLVANKLGFGSWNGTPGSASTGNGNEMQNTVNRNNADVFPFDGSKLQPGDIVTLYPNHVYVYGSGTYPNITVVEQNVNGHSWVDQTTANRASWGETPIAIIRFKNQSKSTGASDSGTDSSSDSSSSGQFDSTDSWEAYEVICDEIQAGPRTFLKCEIVYGLAQNEKIAIRLNDGSSHSVDRECLKRRTDLDKSVTIHDEDAEKMAELQAQIDAQNKELEDLQNTPTPSIDVSAPTTDSNYADSNREYLNDGTFIEDGIRYDANGKPVNGDYYLDGKLLHYINGKNQTSKKKAAKDKTSVANFKKMEEKNAKKSKSNGLLGYLKKISMIV